MANSLYRLLGTRIGNGYERAKSRRHIFRDFVDATAHVTLDKKKILLRFQKPADNPLLLAADFNKTDVAKPWFGYKHLHLPVRLNHSVMLTQKTYMGIQASVIHLFQPLTVSTLERRASWLYRCLRFVRQTGSLHPRYA